MFKLLAPVAALVLASCVAPAPAPDTPPEGENGYSQAAAAECAAKGGDYARRGMLGRYTCAVPYADAGKVCTKESDCLGQCRLADTNQTNGTCQKTDDPFGCYWYLDENGQAVGICVD